MIGQLLLQVGQLPGVRSPGTSDEMINNYTYVKNVDWGLKVTDFIRLVLAIKTKLATLWRHLLYLPSTQWQQRPGMPTLQMVSKQSGLLDEAANRWTVHQFKTLLDQKLQSGPRLIPGITRCPPRPKPSETNNREEILQFSTANCSRIKLACRMLKHQHGWSR